MAEEPSMTMTDVADQIMDAYRKGSTITTATMGVLDMPLEDEPRTLERAAMARTNGAVVVYSRRVEGERALWERLTISGPPPVVAWFYREFDVEQPEL
jgi:hypothetical protein